jgi:hypothetical protein
MVLDKLLRIQEMLDSVCGINSLTKSNEVLSQHKIKFPLAKISELNNLEKLAKGNNAVRMALVSWSNFG